MKWNKTLLSIFGLLLLQLFLLGSSQAASPTIDEQMTLLEEEIWSSLDNLKRNSTSLTEELESLRKQQAISQQTLTELELSLANTLDSYNSLGQQLQYTRLDLQKKQSQVRKLAMILMTLLIFFVSIRVLLIFLKFKKIEIPYWINLIL